MKNVFFEQKEIKLQDKQHFVQNKTRHYAACLKNTLNFFVA